MAVTDWNYFALSSSFFRAKSGGGSHPFLIAVVIDAHHFAAAHADEADDRLKRTAIRPHIHDAHLRLREPVRCVDDRLEAHALLQQEVVTLVCGNCVELRIRGRELDAFAGEGIERLEDPLFTVFGEQAASFAVIPVA